MAKPRSKKQHADNEISLPFDITVPDRVPIDFDSARQDREAQFFNSRTLRSKIKSKIVVDGFLGWASVMLLQNPLALWYVDLYCGRGTYDDGSTSTPVELFDKIAAHPRLPSLLRMLFNDHRSKFVYDLRDTLMAHDGWSSMRVKPQFSHGEVDESMVKELRSRRPKVPTFAFIDPFGYKGLTKDLIRSVLEDYGCDVMFYFAYHPIKRVLNNQVKLRGHVEALLGRERVIALRDQLNSGLPELEMEQAMLLALRESMRSIAGRDVLTFAFRRRTGAASHHLAFVSKNVRGFEVAKEAMARNSSGFYPDHIASLEFVEPGYDQTLIHVDPPSIDRLKALIVHANAGKVVTVQQAYDSVMYNTPYVKQNVREAIVRLARDHGSQVYSDGILSKLRKSKLPRNPSILVPRTLRLPI